MSTAEIPPELKGDEKVDSPESEGRHIYAQVMGVTGAGKTTFVEVIEKNLGFTVLKEPDFAKSDLFAPYCDDPKTYAFPFQLYVLSEVYSQLIGGEESRGTETIVVPGIKDLLKVGPIISEPPPPEHRLYAQARFGDDPSKWTRYEDFYEGLFERGRFPRPDLIVYLWLSFPTMLERINNRAQQDPARGKELQQKPEYWKRLWDLHEEWVRDNSGNFRILTINTDIYDFTSRRFGNEEAGKGALVAEFLNQAKYSCIDPRTGEPKLPPDIVIPEVITTHRPSPSAYADRPPGQGSIFQR